MKTRIISGLIGLAVLIAILMAGGMVFNIAIFAITLIAIYEYGKAVETIKEKHIFNYMNYILSIGFFILHILDISEQKVGILSIYSLLLFAHLVFKKEVCIKDLALTLFGAIYIPFFMSYLYYFEGNTLIWVIFIIAWGTDTFAYFTGMAIGKHKLCPRLSPKKTIEGAIGGILGAIVIMIIFSVTLNIINIFGIVIVSFIGSILSQIGDLTASKIKRISGIKDYGNLIPGHGGILDRFDSMIYIAPFIYYGLNIMGLL